MNYLQSSQAQPLSNSPLQHGLAIPFSFPQQVETNENPTYKVPYTDAITHIRQAFTADSPVPEPTAHSPINPREVVGMSETDFVNLVARLPKAGGSTVIAGDLCNMLTEILQGRRNIVFEHLNQAQKNCCQELFEQAYKLLNVMQRVRTNIDAIRVECGNLTTQAASELAKPFMPL